MHSALVNSSEYAVAPERSAVVRLSLTNFRSYASLKLECDIRPAVFTGPNGAGKTNLLEAISFLLPGRGLRRARLSDVTRSDSGDVLPGGMRWAIAATLDTATGPTEIGTGFEATGEGEDSGRRISRMNGAAARSQSALGDVFAAVWLVPEMDRLFMEGASARRRFLDRLVAAFDPAHTTRLTEYEQAMRERTRLLRDDKSGFRAADSGWLSALEERMAESGVALQRLGGYLFTGSRQPASSVLGRFPQRPFHWWAMQKNGSRIGLPLKPKIYSAMR